MLATLRYKDGLNPELLDQLTALIASTTLTSGPSVKVDIPSDYNRGLKTCFHPPFRVIRDEPDFPKPYPPGMALPRIVGNANDYSFIEEVADLLASPSADLALDIVHLYERDDALASLLASIESQSYRGRIRLHLIGGKPLSKAGFKAAEVVHHAIPFPSEAANDLLNRISRETDLLLFVSGLVALEPMALQRIAHAAAVSDRVVHALMPQVFDESVSPFTTSVTRRLLARSYPFRDVCGLNFAVSAGLYRTCGGFDTRFSDPYHAARELCFRYYNGGCYFRPITTTEVKDFSREDRSDAADRDLYNHLCPNPWDRRRDGLFEVPKISIYIPAYNASQYIVRAVESVLDQDVQDLEVCIADDGSRDGTIDILEHRFGGDPRVHWSSNANGGIGFASNRAIAMARGIYIGQLDSDDCLKPGAVRALAKHLDDNPDVVCCYSSCERVDQNGNFIQNEYSWPVFSREKMMVTSIAHHFRMFRRQAWERTEKFREDIINAVDYDMYLKLSEVGNFKHLDEILYQRRWHGSNTSNVNEAYQTTNTHRVQREALNRLGLHDSWDIHLEKPEEPRRVSYRRRLGRKLVMFWPYYRANPYQRMLYAPHSAEMEICAGTIDAALREIRTSAEPENHIFHVHWLNFVFSDEMTDEAAHEAAQSFLAKVELFRSLGGTAVWTIHNVISHDAKHYDVEVDLSKRLAQIVDVLHFHTAESVAEVAAVFPIPHGKVRVARHGNYIGAYSDLVTREVARGYLGLSAEDDVILFNGQVRRYKGTDTLISAFRRILEKRPTALLIIAGAAREDPLANLDEPLSEFERSRIRLIDRFIDDAELQVFLRAADFAVYPYRNILTSGSLLLALSFGLPVVIPEVAMTRSVLQHSNAGILYDGSGNQLEESICRMLAAKDKGELPAMRKEARALAESNGWQRLF
ncbi:glycosyltransferase [Sphingomonas sp. SM33]|uniref:Glycosyltransferase n=1 Tax=Sphingomonas telluris TaxID=2907998 RepID=A0ABS9VQ94_9SPHN|nr:glycosyltransferase [Sphingomonas telluris]